MKLPRMWDLEADHPWLLALYAAAIVASVAASALVPEGWFGS